MKTVKRALSFALCLALCLGFIPEAHAAHTQVMTANEFIDYLQYVVDRGDSKYGSGGVMSVGKYQYDEADGKYKIYFDCNGLGESIIATRGQIVYNRDPNLNPWNLWDTSCGIQSAGDSWLEGVCIDKSSDFSNLVPGEWLIKRPNPNYWHFGYYIGNGKVIESTVAGENKVQVSTIDSSGHDSLQGSYWTWDYHAKAPWIKYDTVPSYLDKCTWTSCSDIVEITSDNAWLKALPCSNETAKKYGYTSVSVIESALPVGTTFRTSGLYKNSEGNYWYSATIIKGPNEGKSGYIYKGDTKVVYAPQSTLDSAEGGAGTIYVRGWSFDRDELGSAVPIHVYVGGPAGSGANCYIIYADKSRPDVNNVFTGVGDYHGFEDTITVSERGTQTLYFYAIDLGGGPGPQQFATATATISDPTSTGSAMTVGAGRTIPDGDYIIATAADPNYFLDIVGEDLPAANGANVSLYGPRNGEVPAYDVWTVKYIDDGGFYSICQKGTNMSLDVDGASITAGGNIQAYTHHGSSCQQWSIFSNEDGSYRIRAKCSGFSLDYYDGVLAAGTNVVQWFDTAYVNQKWTFIPCTCTVTYDANGGTGAPESQTAEIGSTIILSSDIPSRASITEDYTVTLNANGGSVSQSSMSATHTMSYSFKNWNTEAGGIGTSYNPGASYPANESATLYAQWNYTIKYNSIILPVPTRTGYVFKGWGMSSDAISGVTGSYSPSGNVTLYAIWEEVKYTVSYDANGGIGAPEAQMVRAGTVAILSTVEPTREGYVFLGWASSSIATAPQYLAGSSFMPEKDTTLFAVWEKGTLSEWSEIKPTGVDESLIETKIQYRYRDKETTTSTESSVDGWILEGSQQGWSDYGPWSEWQDSAISSSDSTKVESRTVYPYYYFYCTNCGTGARYPYWGSDQVCEICHNTGTRPNNGVVEWFPNPWSDSIAWGNNTGKYYQYIDGGIWWNWTNGEPKTQYRSSTRSIINTYYFYRWTGWSAWSDNSVAESDTREVETRTLYRYVIKEYTIAYDANGGTNAPNSQTKIHDTALTLTTSTPTHADASAGSYTVTLNANGGSVSTTSLSAVRTTSYSFKNWNTAASGSGTSYAPGASYTANAAATLYAQWNSSTSTAAVTLPTPTRSGYSFLGWGTSSSAASGVTGSYTPTGNVTLYAVWDANSYAVSYDANGGTDAPNSQAKIHDTTLTLTASTPSRANASAGSYTVTLNANGGSVSTTSLSATRTTSYTFKNWNTAANGSGTSYAPGAIYTANAAATLYAQWNSSTSTAAVTLPTPSRSGYSFLGWGTNSSAASGVTGSYTPTGNVTLYAVWDANSYAVSYDANGGTNAPNSQAKIHDTTLTLTASTPSRANASAGSYTVTLNANGGSVSTTSLSATRTTSYTFKNWNTAANGSGTSYAPGASYTANAAATLYAQWNSSTSTAAVTLPTPTRSGYSFLGWGTSSSAASGVTGSYTPTGNVMLYAVWKSPDFTLPAALTNIGDEAFTGGAFTYAKLPENAVSIGWHAFADCPNLAYIYIPAQTTQIDPQAFGDKQGLTIIGKAGSMAETYAQNHNYTFIAIQ